MENRLLDAIIEARSILILPFTELGTKSGRTRDKMMDQLLVNVKNVLKTVFRIEWTKYRQKGERLIFHFKPGDIEGALKALQHVPGIYKLLPCVEVKTNARTLSSHLSEICYGGHHSIPVNNIKFRSMYFTNRQDGEKIINDVLAFLPERGQEDQANTNAVSLVVQVEVHPDFSYISVDARDGLNGHPVGTQNPVAVEIIGRPADLIAAIAMARRGTVITPIFFHLGVHARVPQVHEVILAKESGILDKYHGFPVKKYVHVDFGCLLSGLHLQLKEDMAVDPCALCIYARRILSREVASALHMMHFIVDGTTMDGRMDLAGSCPVAHSMDPVLIPANITPLHPIVAHVPSGFPLLDQYLATLVTGDQPHPALTWPFCKLHVKRDYPRVFPGTLKIVESFVLDWFREHGYTLV